jgi:hypothetical protein
MRPIDRAVIECAANLLDLIAKQIATAPDTPTATVATEASYAANTIRYFIAEHDAEFGAEPQSLKVAP